MRVGFEDLHRCHTRMIWKSPHQFFSAIKMMVDLKAHYRWHMQTCCVGSHPVKMKGMSVRLFILFACMCGPAPGVRLNWRRRDGFVDTVNSQDALVFRIVIFGIRSNMRVEKSFRSPCIQSSSLAVRGLPSSPALYGLV
jgi:hypothetical protein